MTSALTTPTDLDYRLETFADRLVFARVFLARVKTARRMARLLGYKESTYATWEDGVSPQDRFELAQRFEAQFPKVSALWLLQGGSNISSKLRPVVMPVGQMELSLDDHATWATAR